MLNHIKQKLYKLLRASEQYTKTDMVYLAKGGFWLTLGQIFAALSSFLIAIAFANLLPKEAFGTYKYILAVCGILSITTLSGINSAVIQSVARGYDGSFFIGLKTRIRWGMLGALASLIFAGYHYFLQTNTAFGLIFIFIAFFIPFMDPFTIYDSLLTGKKNFKSSSKYSVINQCLATLILLGMLFYTKNIYTLALTYILSWTIIRACVLLIVVKTEQINNKIDTNCMGFGKHLSLMNIIATISTYADRFLLFHYLGASEVAIYSIAIAPVEQIKSIIKNLSTLALPKFSTSKTKEIKRTLPGKLLKLTIALIIVTALYIACSPLLFKLLFPKYLESILFSQIFAITLITTIILFPFSVLQAKQETKKLYAFNVIIYTTQIILLWVFIQKYGILGAVIARVIARFMGLGASLFFVWKE